MTKQKMSNLGTCVLSNTSASKQQKLKEDNETEEDKQRSVNIDVERARNKDVRAFLPPGTLLR